MSIPERTEALKKDLPGYGRGQSWGQRGVGQSIWEESLTPKHRLGDRLQLGCRVFYYAKASGALAAGKMNAFNVDSDEETTVTVAHGIGTTKLTVTAASAITKDQYAEGCLGVWGTGGTGVGDQYIIKSNAAIDASATGEVVIYEPGLATAWVIANTDICLWTSAFYNIKQSDATTSAGAGIALIDVTTGGYYFWLQTYGPAMVLIKTAASSGYASGELAMSVGADGDLYAQIAGHVQSAHVLEVTTDATANDADFGYVFLKCVA